MRGLRARDRPVADAEAIDHARAKRLDEHVRGLGQAEQRLDALRRLEVEDQAPLAAMGVGEPHRDAVALRADLAVRLAARQRLDLDHLGAVVGHRLGHRRPGQEQRQVDHLDAFELHGCDPAYHEGSRFSRKLASPSAASADARFTAACTASASTC